MAGTWGRERQLVLIRKAHSHLSLLYVNLSWFPLFPFSTFVNNNSVFTNSLVLKTICLNFNKVKNVHVLCKDIPPSIRIKDKVENITVGLLLFALQTTWKYPDNYVEKLSKGIEKVLRLTNSLWKFFLLTTPCKKKTRQANKSMIICV